MNTSAIHALVDIRQCSRSACVSNPKNEHLATFMNLEWRQAQDRQRKIARTRIRSSKAPSSKARARITDQAEITVSPNITEAPLKRPWLILPQVQAGNQVFHLTGHGARMDVLALRTSHSSPWPKKFSMRTGGSRVGAAYGFGRRPRRADLRVARLHDCFVFRLIQFLAVFAAS